jgi:hypothetical protein
MAVADSTITPIKHSASNLLLLPAEYRPSSYTVIVGRGREPKSNPGNQRLRELALSFLPEYREEEKRTKTRIVSDILSTIYKACPDGGAFVKHAKDGR